MKPDGFDEFELIMPDVSRVTENPSPKAVMHGLEAAFGTGRPNFTGAWTYDGPNRTLCGLLGRSREGFSQTDRGMAVTCVNCKRAAWAWLEHYNRLTFPWDWHCRPPHGEKFDSVAAERLWEASLHTVQNESAGNAVDGPGWWARFNVERAVIVTNSQGFVMAERFDTDAALSAEWEAVERLVAEWENDNEEEEEEEEEEE